jgi:hypothetical protein
MDNKHLTQHLSMLITKWENEVIEFKLAGADYKTGEYFSALVVGLDLQGTGAPIVWQKKW